VIDWPLSIEGATGEIATERTGETDTAADAQTATVGDPMLLSVTLTE
jgi:hypothetical protein